jgi:hypothetical protein
VLEAYDRYQVGIRYCWCCVCGWDGCECVLGQVGAEDFVLEAYDCYQVGIRYCCCCVWVWVCSGAGGGGRLCVRGEWGAVRVGVCFSWSVMCL